MKKFLGSKKRTAWKPGVREEMLAALPQEVKFKPAKLKVEQIIQQVVKCRKCGKEGSENPREHFQKAAVSSPILPHSMATPALVS